jgi:hypothetical protein
MLYSLDPTSNSLRCLKKASGDAPIGNLNFTRRVAWTFCSMAFEGSGGYGD